MSKVEANLDAAFEMANKWRKATDQEILSAWLPSRVGSPSECLLAAGINSSCTVMYNSHEITSAGTDPGVGSIAVREDGPCGRRFYQMEPNSGRVSFMSAENAQRFAGITGFEYLGRSSVRLPDEIALVAWEFDHGAFQEHAQTIDADKVVETVLGTLPAAA